MASVTNSRSNISTKAPIAEYLDARFARHRFPRSRLARLIHSRTEGNPLFMVNLVEYLVDEAVIVESDGSWTLQRDPASIEVGVPENVRQLIERQIERLDADERRVLEGASVVGMECSSVAIAAGLEEQTGWVEERCEALVRRHQFLLPARLVELPDGTVTPRYTFSHVLYRDVPYRLLAPMRRAQTHRRIGDRGEAIYGDRATEIAAELAMHFEQGRDAARAVKYLLLAAENATGWSAHHEAAALARRGLLALAALSDTPEREESELAAHLDPWRVAGCYEGIRSGGNGSGVQARLAAVRTLSRLGGRVQSIAAHRPLANVSRRDSGGSRDR